MPVTTVSTAWRLVPRVDRWPAMVAHRSNHVLWVSVVDRLRPARWSDAVTASCVYKCRISETSPLGGVVLVLLLTVVLGVVSGVAAGALMLRWRVEVGAPRVAPATVVEEVHRHPRLAAWLRARVDPTVAT